MLKKYENFDIITPHRFSLCILVQDFIKFRNSVEFKYIDDESLRAKYRKDFSIFMLKLIQYPDLELEELWNLLLCSNYEISDYVKDSFQESLHEIGNQGLGYLHDVVEGFSKIMAFNDTSAIVDPEKAFVSKSSPIGSYMRRLILNFDKLSFSEVTLIYSALQTYVKSTCPLLKIPNEKKLLNIDQVNSDKDLWTRRQAEMFIGKQVDLLQKDEESAANPKDIQNAAVNILKTNSNLAEAHFMNYLNCVRIKEFCGAQDSLYHYFDMYCSTYVKNEEQPKVCRFASLNLAILHYQFGHYNEALNSLNESIQNAQEANDNECLQHALPWLYRLVMHNDKLMPISKEYNINSNLLGIESFVQLSSLLAAKPYSVFDTLVKFDIINDQNNQIDLISNSFSLKSCLWTFYGKTEMTNFCSQHLLFLNPENPNSLKRYSEAYCLSLYNVANYLVAQGEYMLGHSVLRLGKNEFLNETNSTICMIFENNALFLQSLYNEKWADAEKAAQRLSIFDKIESYLRLAELYLHKLDFNESNRYINLILKDFDIDNKFKFKLNQIIRAKLLLVEIQFASTYPNSVPMGILDILCDCLKETRKNHMDYYMALVFVYMAHIQLHLKMTSQALFVLNKGMATIMAHGGLYDRAGVLVIYVKCFLANSKAHDKKDILISIDLLEEAKMYYKKVEAFARVKDVLFLQARLYHSIGMGKEQNSCALEFRLLDEEFKSQRPSLLFQFL